MREKDLRLALICYGGISLAVYMHGITKEIWHAVRASRAHHDALAGDGLAGGSLAGDELAGDVATGDAVAAAPAAAAAGGQAAHLAAYRGLFQLAEERGSVRLKLIADIIAGASAGGINGIFLARALATGQSLEPLTRLWLDNADVETLLDPDARPISRLTKWWAVPLAWLMARRPGNTIEKTVEKATRAEVRSKLSRFVRARWFAPPFGGEQFCHLLLDAFAAMEKSAGGPPLVPPGHPIDLIVTVTDYYGHKEPLVLNSPADISEVEHRLTISFRERSGAADGLGDAAALAFAARATASFPGAFPPFTVGELDRTLAARKQRWAGRSSFLARILPRQWAAGTAEQAVLLDGSVLANAPFRPAIAALRNRSARREVDRRFVFIDPKPDVRSLSFGATASGDDAAPEVPGFFRTIFGAMSDIPREQPIRENIDMLEGMSARIRRTRRIVMALQPEVDERVAKLFGRTLFLDRPTAARLASWRAKAQARASADAGFAYPAYGHLKLSMVVEDMIQLGCRLLRLGDSAAQSRFRKSAWDMLRERGLDRISPSKGEGASPAVIAFFRAHDLGFRIRRLRHVARRVDDIAEASPVPLPALEDFRRALYAAMAHYLDRETEDFFDALPAAIPQGIGPLQLFDMLERTRDLVAVDALADAVIADALAPLPRAMRRTLLLAYLGFPFVDIATLSLLRGEDAAEADPIKIDRISPNDCVHIRTGGAAATLKGIQFNSFGAFFSAAYRENDYLWGRLHGAERLIDIVASSAGLGDPLSQARLAELRRSLFRAILDEEAARLSRIQPLIAQLREEIG